MFSRFILSLTALFLFSACDSKIGEAPPKPTVQEFDATQCLSRLNPAVTAFFKGDATSSQITQSWDCVITAAETFKRYVRGQSSTEYTSQEIATFLEKNFLDPQLGQKITPALQLEFMKVKQTDHRRQNGCDHFGRN